MHPFITIEFKLKVKFQQLQTIELEGFAVGTTPCTHDGNTYNPKSRI